MKILYITSSFSRYAGDPLGGIGNSFYTLFQEIAKNNQVDVVCPIQEYSKKIEKNNNIIIYRESPSKSYISFQSMMKSAQVIKIPLIIFNLYLRSLRLIYENNYDIIHGLFIFPAGLITSLLPTKSKKVISALGSDVHTLSYYKGISKLYNWIFNHTDSVTYIAKDMQKRLKIMGAGNLHYMPLPVNDSIFKFSPLIPECPRFIFVGRLTREKGIEILLKSFNYIIKELPNAKLYIVGDGPEKNWANEFISNNKLQKNIEIKGIQSSLEIARLIQYSYALLLPSYNEGTPAVILEAMSVGRPIVATRVGELKNLIDQESGYLTEIGNVSEFKKAILKIYHKKYNAYKIHKKVNKFQTKKVSKMYLKYYNNILTH